MSNLNFLEKSIDHFEDECAVFGVFAPGFDVARLTCFGLQALQHRGQESAGIAVGDGETIIASKDLGLVTQVFNESSLAPLQGYVSVGHVRYSTSGKFASWEAAQPHISMIGDTLIALAHNGTLVNTKVLRELCNKHGVELRSNSDSELAAKIIGEVTASTHSLRDGIRKAMNIMRGAYAMVLASPDSLYAFRDPFAIRPLVIGQLDNNSGWVVSSETCGLDIVGAKYVREVKPGEIVRFNSQGMLSEIGIAPRNRASCIFEYIYFARPDSIMDGQSIYLARRNMGQMLARESPIDADLVLGVPDSGLPSALGFANESKIPYSDAIIKNRYVGRTFIEPTNEMRQIGIRIKLNPIPSIISGKRIIVVDDSIVRGNTSKKLVEMLREAGATEIHLRIVSPETKWPCFYGIDTDTQDQLISANMTVEETCKFIGADSLAFLSIKALHDSIHVNNEGFCDACFSGNYPVSIPKEMQQRSFLKG